MSQPVWWTREQVHPQTKYDKNITAREQVHPQAIYDKKMPAREEAENWTLLCDDDEVSTETPHQDLSNGWFTLKSPPELGSVTGADPVKMDTLDYWKDRAARSEAKQLDYTEQIKQLERQLAEVKLRESYNHEDPLNPFNSANNAELEQRKLNMQCYKDVLNSLRALENRVEQALNVLSEEENGMSVVTKRSIKEEEIRFDMQSLKHSAAAALGAVIRLTAVINRKKQLKGKMRG